MNKFLTFLLGVFPLLTCLYSQDAPVITLGEVVVSDSRLLDYGTGHRLETLSDSILYRGSNFLSGLLSTESSLYSRENGYGMVASPALRGTNAAHTAVVWNGININSPLNGQVDFNTVVPQNYDAIGIRYGGSSVLYGTGAIGGSVHLNNDLSFVKHLNQRVTASYGSYQTHNLNVRQDFGSVKWAWDLGINHLASDNDYAYPGTDMVNENGAFDQWAVNVSAGHRLGDESYLKLYHQSFISDRELSGTIVAPGRSRYKDTRHQSQIHLVLPHGRFRSEARLAHLYEQYRYYENKDSESYSLGEVRTLLGRYQLETTLTDSLKLSTTLEYQGLRGSGSDIATSDQNNLSLAAVFRHRPLEPLAWTFQLRYDINSEFNTPLLAGIGMEFSVTDWYLLKLNASRNFRLPTFNDLYWQPGGNPGLIPETSYQADLGHEFLMGDFMGTLNTYYIATREMIRWLPDNSGLWSPVNTDAVTLYGAEATLGYVRDWAQRHRLELRLGYSYTVAKEDDTGEQLIYVPYHRVGGSAAYRHGPFRAFFKHSLTGPVAIIGGQLDGFNVAHAGLEYKPMLRGKWGMTLGFAVNNLFDSKYEIVALRPMPNRNFNTYITLIF